MSEISCNESDKDINSKYLPRWPSVNVEFKDLSYSVPDPSGKKVILSGISGKFHSGQVTAVLGPSGAGKSTLLNILAAFNYMMVSADLKLGKDLTKLQKNEVIAEILDLLRLTKTSQTMCQQLSGGERKRLSIALELVDNPPVIFLDEPTTGLDDLSSSQCISLLRRIALGGRTVVCSMHTPSAKILEMFDLVYAIAGGQCVYQGNPSQIVPYLQTIGLTCPLTYNPADFLVDVSCGDYGVEHIDRMINAIENGKCFDWSLPRDQQFVLDGESEEDKAEQSSQHIDSKQLKCRSNSWDQFKVLYNRQWKQMWRDSRHVKLQIYATFCVAVLVGFLFQGCGNDATKAMFNIRYQFTVIIFSMFFPLMTVLLRCEFALFKREYFNRWCKLAPYYWAFLLSDAPLQIGIPLIFVTISYPMSNQPLELMRFLMFVAMAIMVSLISKSMGLLVASRMRLIIGIFVGPTLTVSFLILAVSRIGYGSGTNVPLFLKLLNVTYVRFALEGLFEAVYGSDRADSVCPDTEMFCLLANAGYLKNVLGFHDSSYLVSMVALWSFLLLFTTTAYVMVKMRLP